MGFCENHGKEHRLKTQEHFRHQAVGSVLLESDIRQRAYEHYLGRGASQGGELDDWLRAERELKQAMMEAHCPTCASNR